MKKLFTLASVMFIAAQTFAQSQEKITLEQVKSQCASMPLSKRARVSVTRFNVTTTSANDAAATKNAHSNNKLKALSMLMGGGGDGPKADAVPTTLGGNMATMLTNALQGLNCYRVLENLNNNGDLTGEIDAGDSKYSSKKAPKAGKQLGAQIAATGEITEYSVKDKGLNIVGVGTNKIGENRFNLKLTNIETRDIIASRIIRVQSKTSSSVSVLGGLVSTSNEDPAIAAVMEDGVLEAVRYMAHVRDSLDITVDNIPGNVAKSANSEVETEISLANANFNSFNDVAKIVGALPGFKSMEKSLSSGVGTFTVIHSGSADDLLNSLNAKLGSKYEVTGFNADKIEMKVK